MSVALILVPGLLCDRAVYAPQLSALQDLATLSVAEHGVLDSLAAMAERVLDAAPPVFAIAGHSMGGRVVMEIMRQAPERVVGMALLDTACWPLPAGAAGDGERCARLTLLDLARREGMQAMARVWVRNMVHPSRLTDQPLIATIVAMLARHTPEHYAAQIHALLARPDATNLLRGVRCPSLVLFGSDDYNAPPDGQRSMHALLADASLVEIAACGHMSTLERPQAVSEALRLWLQRI